MNSERFEKKGSFFCRDGKGRSQIGKSNKKVCFVATDQEFLSQTLYELSQRPDCYFVKYSADPKDGDATSPQ